jgi:2-polyprenyl-3-methyl-5-hydroxy-6-metoxy-1,4-benzoquinol methylase
MNCPICGCENTRITVSELAGRYSIRKCGSCSVEFLSPIPDSKELEGIYTSAYYKSWGMEASENNIVATMKKATFKKRLATIKRYCNLGTILDVGTASGFFLEVARDMGFEPYGVELSKYSASLAKQKFGDQRIYNGVLEDAPFPKGSFDCVTMSDLLEHVTDPVKTLTTAAQFLKPDGILMIMTPNTKSFSRKTMGTGWAQYKAEHLFYFNRQSISFLCGKTGYAIMEISPAWKAMNFSYMKRQFEVYKHPLITPAINVLHTLLNPIKDKSFNILMGEMVVIARKTTDTHR